MRDRSNLLVQRSSDGLRGFLSLGLVLAPVGWAGLRLCQGGGKPVPGLTLKKVMVAPSFTAPYSIFVCFAKSSAESMGDSILSTVRKAARLAV